MLTEWREEIDKLDEELLIILGKRFKVVDKIGKYKKEKGIEIVQNGRWQEVLQNRITLGKIQGLDECLIRDIWESIHKEAIRKEHN